LSAAFRLTLGYTTLYAGPLETITAAAEAGFNSVGIRITGRRPSDPDAGVIGNTVALRQLSGRLRSTGMRLSNVSAYHFHPGLELSDYLPVIEASAELGAPFIVASCYDADEQRYVETLERFAEAAADFAISLALEFIPYSEAKTIEDARRLIRRAGRPNLGILVDSLHLDRSEGVPADVAAIEPNLISYAQLCDASSRRPLTSEALRNEAITGRLYPGEGSLPLFEFLDALPAGAELECELPNAALSSLSVVEKARRAHQAMTHFFDAYASARNTK